MLRRIRLLATTLLVTIVHTAAFAQGTVATWGSNYFGTLGNGTSGLAGTGSDQSTPVQVLGPGAVGNLAGVTAVAGMYDHTLAIRNDGTVWAWGNGEYGALGDGTVGLRETPVQVLGPNGVGFLTNVIAVAGGYHHSLALKADGTVWAWGLNSNGQLGDGSAPGNYGLYSPVQVLGPDGVGVLDHITAISAGGGSSFALRDDGTLWSWGYNGHGTLGDGTYVERHVPTQALLTGVMAIAAGWDQIVALKSDGTAWGWGYNGLLSPGYAFFRGSPGPVFEDLAGATPLADVVAVAAGAYHSMALKSDGSVWTWGANYDGQLGNGLVCSGIGGFTGPCVTGGTFLLTAMWPPANQVIGLAGVTAVAAGGYHCLALKSDGLLWAWGMNSYGQLGNGASLPGADTGTPGQVLGVSGGYLNNVVAVAGGYLHSVTITAAAAGEPAAITSANATTFTVGSVGSFTVTTTGSPAPTLSVVSALPGGVTFIDNGDGTATLGGTPAAGTGGAYPLTITAANGVSSEATQSFTLTIDEPPPPGTAPAFTSASATTFTAGLESTFTITTTGSPTVTTIGIAGALPAGVTFTSNADGTATLSGAPDIGSEGLYPLAFSAANGILPDALQNFTLTVEPAPTPLRPDLVERRVHVGKDSVLQGGSFDVDETVTNRTRAAAAPSTTRFYLVDRRRDGSFLLGGSRFVPAFGGSQATRQSRGLTTVTVPVNVPAGTYHVMACADDLNVVQEADETNNCFVGPRITVR